MTLADYLAQFLKIQGVTHIFGLPGGENVAIIEAMTQIDLEYILFHHEISTGFAADVTGQLTEIPGVCMSTSGPGAVNLAAVAASATGERSPMLAITADLDSRWQDKTTHMRVDLPALFSSVTKGSFTLTPESAEMTLKTAWQLALAPPRGAVHISVTPDIAKLPVTSDSPKPVVSPLVRTVSQIDLDALKPHLQQAKNLFIVAGLGLEVAGAQFDLMKLVERWQVPVAVTPKIKGHFPEDHSLFAGVFTAYGDTALREALTAADLVLAVGLDSIDFVTSVWDIDTPIISLNVAEADDIALRPQLISAINGNLGQMLRYLTDNNFYEPQKCRQDQVANLRQSIAEALITPTTATPPGTIPIHKLITALQQTLPEDGAVTVDVGAFKLVFLQQWQAHRPKSVFVSNGLACMGYAIPGAIGFRQAEPDRSIVAIVGDGALLMYAGELATVSRLRQPLVILVVVDEAFSLIRLKQLQQAVPVQATEFNSTDYAALSKAFGLEYRLINCSAKAEDVLAEALQLKTPVLVEARIDKREYDRFR